jgi:hypothetical protein
MKIIYILLKMTAHIACLQSSLKPLRHVLEQLVNMKYYKNEAAHSGAVHGVANHEDAIENIFKDNGYVVNASWYEGNLPSNRKKLNNWVNNGMCDGEDALDNIIPCGTYIPQPFGTHKNPDFVIRDARGKLFAFEAKSAKKSAPMYNSGGLKHNFVYVFSNEKNDSTVVYLGRDIVTIEQQKLIDEHINRAREQDIELNRRLKEIDTNDRGISYYTRPMIQQNGGATQTDYFAHKNKIIAQKNVTEFVS